MNVKREVVTKHKHTPAYAQVCDADTVFVKSRGTGSEFSLDFDHLYWMCTFVQWSELLKLYFFLDTYLNHVHMKFN